MISLDELIKITKEDLVRADIKAHRQGRILVKNIELAKQAEQDIRTSKKAKAAISRAGISTRMIDATIRQLREEVPMLWQKVRHMESFYYQDCNEVAIIEATLRELEEKVA